jgi:hypothetical protein
MQNFRDRPWHGLRSAARPRRALTGLRVESLEGRQLMAIAIFPPTPKFGPTPPTVTVNGQAAILKIPPTTLVNGQLQYEGSPDVILPNTGRLEPITVAGTFSQILVTSLAGPQLIQPTPYIQAAKASLPSITPVTPGAPPLIVPVTAVPGGVPALPPVVSGGRPVIYQVQPPAYELAILQARLQARAEPAPATFFITDQYRKDQPTTHSPIAPVPTPDGKPLYVPIYATYFVGKAPNYAEVQILTGYQLNRNYSYSFSFYLQAKANSNTDGRRYSATIYDVDQDDGGAYTFQIRVPAPSGHH